MAQAKRRKPVTKKKATASIKLSSHGLGMLLTGVVIGCLGTILWQGYQSRDSEVGSGIRKMIENSRQQSAREEEQTPQPVIKPEPQSTNYDFFTVLPEIEVVVSGDEASANAATPDNPTPEVESKKPPVSDKSIVAESKKPKSAFMLQAGSYNKQADANRQKANLALIGLSSLIQKVTIQGRGDFFRVRLGPFTDHAQMVQTDDRLRQEGIKALRLKISRGG